MSPDAPSAGRRLRWGLLLGAAAVMVVRARLLLAAGAIAWLARGLRPEDRVALVGSYVVVTTLTLLTAVGDKAMLLGSVWASSRYVYAPGAVNFDIAVQKEFSIRERTRIQLRVDMFNAFNRANFKNPDTNVSNTTFGKISSTGPARNIQFGLKLLF